ncbi:MAG: mercury methylation ferredoxin HgcB [Treponemataceae bacterium]|nr:mercury methylation ferredoxin HgcB [Treponemataceae bacterium]
MEFRYIRAGRSLFLDSSQCIGCGLCREVCPHGVFTIADGKAHIADRGRCMECGACARNCPAGALRVTAGVGCTAAVIGALLKGGEPNCDCNSSNNGKDCACC